MHRELLQETNEELESQQHSRCRDYTSNSFICDQYDLETRQNYYQSIWGNLSSVSQDFESFKATCIDLEPVVKKLPISHTATTVYDPEIHRLDERAQYLLDYYTDIVRREYSPVYVEGDGNCMKEISTLYEEISAINDENH
ncbi:unnamed protein product [Didymodactylos carnosus]|uniref:Uncharacterized protein n=1 Tax=Didymodactylos carnosus TaxID=1234261 RepID=A0A816FSI6_9BILA|nr:unnamed protein product [Didymodactylos carnosus]CAF4623278.1 unnamed protein product [Didymodactylos carnosus]